MRRLRRPRSEHDRIRPIVEGRVLSESIWEARAKATMKKTEILLRDPDQATGTTSNWLSTLNRRGKNAKTLSLSFDVDCGQYSLRGPPLPNRLSGPSV